jgi:hypothetical protein
MERRYRVRLAELFHDAEVPPGLFRGVVPRLEAFLQPFVDALHAAAQRTNAQHYVQGLLSDLVHVQATFFRFAGCFLGGSVCWRCSCCEQP